MRTFQPLKILWIAVLFVLGGSLGHAQASLAGDWEGTLQAGPNEVHLVWHVTAAADGTVTSTFDNKDEGVSGIKVKELVLKDSKLTVTIDDQVEVNGETINIRGTLEGTLNADGTEVTGNWTQTDPEPQGPVELHLKRVGAAAPAAAPKS